MKQSELLEIIINAVEPFAMNEEQVKSYLHELNDLPAYDIILNFFEMELIYEQNSYLLCDMGDFRRKVEKIITLVGLLPEESDKFWTERWGCGGCNWENIAYLSELITSEARELFRGGK